MDVFEAIAGRRSIRAFTKENVPEEDLAKMLEAGRMAPSWVNFQVWEIIEVRNESTKAKLSETLPTLNPAKNAVANAPVVLVACGRKAESGYKKGEPSTALGDFAMFDVALFLQNVTLAAHALGYGTVHVGLFDQTAVAKMLGVPNNVQVIEIIPIGRPEGLPPKAPKRRALSEFVHNERY